MKLPDLRAKQWGIFGPKGSGKTNLSRYIILSQFKDSHLVIDPQHESKNNFPTKLGFKVYHTEAHSGEELEKEVNEVTKTFILREDVRGKIKCAFYDEINKFAPPKPSRLPEYLERVNDDSRQDNLSFGYACRRPVTMNGDIVEISDYLFIFKLFGKNDKQYMDSIMTGISETIEQLGEHEFIMLDLRKGTFEIMKAPLVE